MTAVFVPSEEYAARYASEMDADAELSALPDVEAVVHLGAVLDCRDVILGEAGTGGPGGPRIGFVPELVPATILHLSSFAA